MHRGTLTKLSDITDKYKALDSFNMNYTVSSDKKYNLRIYNGTNDYTGSAELHKEDGFSWISNSKLVEVYINNGSKSTEFHNLYLAGSIENSTGENIPINDPYTFAKSIYQLVHPNS